MTLEGKAKTVQDNLIKIIWKDLGYFVTCDGNEFCRYEYRFLLYCKALTKSGFIISTFILFVPISNTIRDRTVSENRIYKAANSKNCQSSIVICTVQVIHSASRRYSQKISIIVGFSTCAQETLS